MHRLPQQEPGEPLLARGADDQVGVGLALGVEVLGDVLLAEGGGHLLQARPGGGPLAQQLAHGVGDLLPTPVADGDVDLHAPVLGLSGLDGLIRRPALLGGLRARRPGADDGGAQALGQRLGQEVDGTHEAQAPAAGLGELVNGVGDDVQQGRELGRVAGEVVGAQQPQGDDLDPHLLGPPEELLDLVSAALVALRSPEAHGLGPAAVAVEDDTHVVGHRGRVDARSQPALVDVVEEVVACHAVFLGAPRWGYWGRGPTARGHLQRYRARPLPRWTSRLTAEPNPPIRFTQGCRGTTEVCQAAGPHRPWPRRPRKLPTHSTMPAASHRCPDRYHRNLRSRNLRSRKVQHRPVPTPHHPEGRSRPCHRHRPRRRRPRAAPRP